MEIRPIESGDIPEMKRLHAVCYNTPSDLSAVVEENDKFKDAFGLFERGRLRSVMTSHEQRMFFEGESVAIAGIGGVATFPEFRRMGYVRELLKFLFPRMREEGQNFSLLYPFSFPYYRLFGYELAYAVSAWTVPLSQIGFLLFCINFVFGYYTDASAS